MQKEINEILIDYQFELLILATNMQDMGENLDYYSGFADKQQKGKLLISGAQAIRDLALKLTEW